MKNFRLIALLAVVMLFSCKKNSDDNDRSNVQVINASVNSGAIDVMTPTYPLAQNVAYGFSSGYQNVPSGMNLNATVNITGNPTVWASGGINLTSGQNYTIIASDYVNAMKVGILLDDLTPPPAGQSKIRFFHLSKTTPPVDIQIGSTTVFTQRSFNDYLSNSQLGNFTNLTVPGGVPVNISAYVYGAGGLLYTLPSVTFQPGKIYTLVLIGELGGTGNSDLRCVLVYN
jgi:hypothetical protein